MVTLVDVGLAAIAKMINGVEAISAFTQMATGSGTTDESTSQTALIAENTTNGAARGAATCTYETLGISKWVKTFTFTGSVTINELAIFNPDGIMLMRHKLAATKSYSDGESVEITLTNTSSRV